MVDREKEINAILNALLKTFTCGEFSVPHDMLKDYGNIICYKHHDGTLTIRTEEYNNKAVNKW